jgi:hypothetical protein
MTNVVSIRDHQSRIWDEFLTAQRRAQLTGSMQDGIAAGRAWRRWLDVFMTEEQREILDRKSA